MRGVIRMGVVDEQKKLYRLWYEQMGIKSTADINRIIDMGKIGELIDACEARHTRGISDIAKEIAKKRSRVVFIAGPSSSGKTTTALKLQMRLNEIGINAVSVSLDDYYMDSASMPKNAAGGPDFEALESIDYRRFNENLSDLTAGREAVMPEFSFTKRAVIPEARRLRLRENELVIVEGIHALNPKLGDNIGENEKFRLYCTALCALDDENGKKIPSLKLRQARRLVRDFYFRNSDYKVTFGLWTNQETSARKNIYPYSDTADAVFNSALAYEWNVYRPHLLKVLDGADEDYEFIDDIRYLRELAKSLTAVDEDIIPKASLVREFIGGGTLKY